jgi:hypothetical protein
MTSFQYIELFEMQIKHSYYKDGRADGYSIVPTIQSSHILNQFDVRLNVSPSGSKVMMNKTASIAEMLGYIKATKNVDYFEFYLQTKEVNFPLITDVPLDWHGHIDYKSSDSEKEGEENRWTLTPNFIEENGASELGRIKIYFDDILKSETPPLYTIAFEARKTQWQYYIINMSEMVYDNLSIIGESMIEFSAPEKVKLPKGNTALFFSSQEQLIPLSEFVHYKFDLINEKMSSDRNSEQIVFKGLPIPNAINIGQVKVGNKQELASLMYVYI